MDQVPTERQIELLDFIKGHIADYAIAPTLEEMCDALGVKSAGSVSKHVDALIACGSLVRNPGSRQILVTGRCPYCGRLSTARTEEE
jgi:SOS-response transcriptional repressor LexA